MCTTEETEPTTGKAEGESCDPGYEECAEGLVCRDVEDSSGNYVPMCTTEETEPQSESGVWRAADGSEGTWTSDDVEGRRWVSQDGSRSGTWDFDLDTEDSGYWNDDEGLFEGTWASYDDLSLKVATSDTSGVWYAPDDSTGFWNTN